jgi:hypothetical protein
LSHCFSWRLALLVLVGLAAAGGCQKKAVTSAAAEAKPQEDFKIVEKVLADGMILQEIDLNDDHKPDVFNTYQPRSNAPRLLVRKEVDLNLDGQVDKITYFNEKSELEREEMDGNFDGQFDWTDHYQDNQRVMSEVDSDGNGKMDQFSYYEGTPPRITRKERDTDGDTWIDVWERFDENGVVNRTGRDTDGDHKMDERDE